MKKLKINKKIVTVATYTIAILCAINFAIYPGTNAIFKKDNDRALAYETNLKDVYKNSIINPDNKRLIDLVATNNEKTTPTNAVFGIPFKIDSENKGIYRISMSNTKSVCTVLGTTDATPINLTLKEIENSNPKDYYLTPSNESVTTGTVYVSCPVAIDDMNYKIKLYEHVETTVGETIEVEDEFLYASSELVLDYNAYQSQFSSLYKEFYESFQEYKINNVGAGNNEYDLEEIAFRLYFKEKFEIDLTVPATGDGDPTRILNRVASTTENEEQVIPGVNYNSTTKKFEFDEYFIGYVQTYYYNRGRSITMLPGTRAINMFFTKEDITPYALKSTINLIFVPDDRYDNPIIIYDYIRNIISSKTIDGKEYYNLNDIKRVPGHNQSAHLTTYQASFNSYIIDNAYNYINGINITDEKINLRISSYTSILDYIIPVFNDSMELIKIKANQNNKDYDEIVESMKESFNQYNDFYMSIIYIPDLIEAPSVYREIHKNSDDYKLVKVERFETEGTTDVIKNISITNLNELNENEEIKINNYIEKYLKDHNLIMTMENLDEIPGLVLTTIMNSETPGQIKSQYIAFDDNFMNYADMYLNGISQEEMLKLINKDSTSLAANLYSEELINSIITNITKVPDSTLNNAINTPGVKTYYEAHYDEKNKKLVLISVSSNADGTSTTKIETMLDCFNDDIIENKELIESIAKNTGKTETTMIYLFITDDVATKANDKLVNSFKEYFRIASISAADDRAYYEDVINKDISYSIYDLRLVASKIGS